MSKAMKAPGFFTWMLPTLLLTVLALAFARWQTSLSERHLHDLGEKTAASIALAVSRDLERDNRQLVEARTLAAASVGMPRIHYISIELPAMDSLQFGTVAPRGRSEVHKVAMPAGGRVTVHTADLGWVTASPLLVAIVTGTAILLTLRLALFVRRREHEALASLNRLAQEVDADRPDRPPARFEDLQSALEEIAARIRDFRSDVRDELDRSTSELRRTLNESRGKNVELESSRRAALVASQAKSEFLASISHEVRTPLDVILGYKDLLGDTPLDRRQRSYVNAIEQAAENLLDILDDVLNLSRIEAGKLSIHEQPFSLRENIDSVAQMLAPSAYRKGLDFIRDVSVDVPDTVSGDPLRVRQVLVNLLTNAIKFTRAGHVRLSVSAEQPVDDRAMIAFAIGDSGIGISADDQRTLFEPFSRSANASDERGTGLGLVITKRLCEAMHGSIEVDSRAGLGSTFTARLPLTLLPANSLRQAPAVLADTPIVVWSAEPALSDALVRGLEARGAVVARLGSDDASDRRLRHDAARAALVVLVIGRRLLDDEVRLERLKSLLPDTARIISLVSSSTRSQLRRIERQFGGEALPMHTPPSVTVERIEALLSNRPVAAERPGTGDTGDAAPVLEGMHLLVAEDNRFSQDYLRTLLSRYGATVDVCSDGQAACELLATHHYDLVLMDLRMPGCDGITAMRRLAADGAMTPPVVGLTAAETDCEAARHAGMIDCLVKPVRTDVLLKYLSKHHHADRMTATGASPALDAEMLAELQRELPLYALELREQFARGDMVALLEQTHQINGTAALCGFKKLRESAARLEGALHRHSHANLDKLIEELSDQIDDLCALLDDQAAAS